MTIFRNGYGLGGLALDDLARIQDEFNSYFSRGSYRYPPINVWMADNDLVVDAEVPGFDTGDIDISVHENRLTIAGCRKSEKNGDKTVYFKRERAAGDFSRTLELPFAADPAKVSAAYRNGILRIMVPRAEKDKPKKIKIETTVENQEAAS